MVVSTSAWKPLLVFLVCVCVRMRVRGEECVSYYLHVFSSVFCILLSVCAFALAVGGVKGWCRSVGCVFIGCPWCIASRA